MIFKTYFNHFRIIGNVKWGLSCEQQLNICDFQHHCNLLFSIHVSYDKITKQHLECEMYTRFGHCISTETGPELAVWGF